MTNLSKRGEKLVQTNIVHVVMIFHMLQFIVYQYLDFKKKTLNKFLQTTKHILLHYYFLAFVTYA
jgi:hypothetical protein